MCNSARCKSTTTHRLLPLTLAVALFIAWTATTAADDTPPELPLWPAGAPGAVGDTPADRPTLTLFLVDAKQATGGAMIVCPGGGYQHLAIDYEGTDVARWLNTLGISAGVLRYRLAPRYQHPRPLEDAQRALRMVRYHAAEWHIDPARIGILGFSAGGHLASTAGTHFDAGYDDADDPIERVSCRPDLMILAYPVVALATDYAHQGSRKNLLGEQPDPAVLAGLSNETQVTPQTPPTFLVHSDTDAAVVPENSILFYLALRKAKVPAELHVYEQGPHGFGLGVKDPELGTWPKHAAAFLQRHGFLSKP